MKRAFYWSVRRELWEHRSIWIAPLAVGVFALLAFVIALFGHFSARSIGVFSSLPIDKQREIVAMPFGLAASMVGLTAWVVAVFYCLDALHGERRDRSILFWKSMPVSDLTTVLAKAAIPIVVVPCVALAIAWATQALLLPIAAAGLSGSGVDMAFILERLSIGAMAIAFAYGLAVHALWYAPIFALLLLVSAAVRRPLLWIVVPVAVVQVLEKIAFGTNHSGEFLMYRLLGGMAEAFAPSAMRAPVMQLSQLEPVRFFTSPSLWLGLLAAAAFLYIAVRVRRSKEALS